jgi:hypothetical protein
MACPIRLKRLQGGAENGIDTLSRHPGLRTIGLNDNLKAIFIRLDCAHKNNIIRNHIVN